MAIHNIAEAIGAILPEQLGEDMRTNINALARSTFENMQLVSREELEVQEKVLQRTREKLKLLEARVDELESRLNLK